MATPHPNQPQTPTVPAAGTRISVRVDAGMSDDLAIIMRTGCDASDAVRQPLIPLADSCHGTWTGGHYPDGIMPRYTSTNVKPYNHARTPEQPV